MLVDEDSVTTRGAPQRQPRQPSAELWLRADTGGNTYEEVIRTRITGRCYALASPFTVRGETVER